MIKRTDKTHPERVFVKILLNFGEHKQCALGLSLKGTMVNPFVATGGGSRIVPWQEGENFIIDLVGT